MLISPSVELLFFGDLNEFKNFWLVLMFNLCEILGVSPFFGFLGYPFKYFRVVRDTSIFEQ